MENVNIEIDQNPSHGNVKYFPGQRFSGRPGQIWTNMDMLKGHFRTHLVRYRAHGHSGDHDSDWHSQISRGQGQF